MPDDVVITGFGIASPIGCGQERFWDSLLVGRTGAAPIDCLDTSELSRKIGCQVREPLDLGRPMGRAAQLAVAASRQALGSAGLAGADLKDSACAVTVGTTMGETDFIEERLAAPQSESCEHPYRSEWDCDESNGPQGQADEGQACIDPAADEVSAAVHRGIQKRFGLVLLLSADHGEQHLARGLRDCVPAGTIQNLKHHQHAE